VPVLSWTQDYQYINFGRPFSLNSPMVQWDDVNNQTNLMGVRFSAEVQVKVIKILHIIPSVHLRVFHILFRT
jgi:hypothetical protein